MWRSIKLWLAALLVGLVVWLPAGNAQGGRSVIVPKDPAGKGEKSDAPSVLALFATVIFSLVILLVVCMPSRKSL